MERGRRRRTARRGSEGVPCTADPPLGHGGFQRLVRPLPQGPASETSVGGGGELHGEGGARAKGESVSGRYGEMARSEARLVH